MLVLGKKGAHLAMWRRTTPYTYAQDARALPRRKRYNRDVDDGDRYRPAVNRSAPSLPANDGNA